MFFLLANADRKEVTYTLGLFHVLFEVSGKTRELRGKRSGGNSGEDTQGQGLSGRIYVFTSIYIIIEKIENIEIVLKNKAIFVLGFIPCFYVEGVETGSFADSLLRLGELSRQNSLFNTSLKNPKVFILCRFFITRKIQKIIFSGNGVLSRQNSLFITREITERNFWRRDIFSFAGE